MIQNRIQLNLPSTTGRIPQSLLQTVQPAANHATQVTNTRIGKHGRDDAPAFLVVVEIIWLLLGLDAVGGGDCGELNVGGEVGEGGTRLDVIVFAAFAGA